MFNRQFSLVVMATLLLSPNLVQANEIDRDTHLSVGNIQIHNTAIGTKIQTQNLEVGTPTTTENRVLISRSRRRYHQTAIRRTRTSAPAIFRQRTVDADEQATIITPSVIRSAPIQSSSNSSQSVNEQRQSIQCSGGGSVVAQTTSTVNGRTVRSESRSNCD